MEWSMFGSWAFWALPKGGLVNVGRTGRRYDFCAANLVGRHV